MSERKIKNINRGFKGIWIPAKFWLNADLTIQEILFLVEIDSLDISHKGCFASNKHFSDFFGITKGRCSQIIKSLHGKGYINIEYQREGQEVKSRTINVVNKLNTPINYSKGGYLENAKESNTSFSNTDINSSSSSKDSPIHLYQQLFGVLNPINQQDINYWVEDLSEELVVEAMKKAALDNKSYSYAVGIMKQWAKHNVRTLEDVKAYEVSFKNNKKSYSNNKKPVRKEELPYWAKDDYDWEKEEQERKEQFEREHEELNKRLQQTNQDDHGTDECPF